MSEIITAFRKRVGDNTNPPKTPDAEIADLANEAEQQVCMRAHLLTDSATQQICQITLDPTKAFYDLDPRILDVLDVWIDGVRHPLTRCSYESLQYKAKTDTVAGTPYRYAVIGEPSGDGTTSKMQLVLEKRPAAILTTLHLTVDRLPKTALTVPVTSPASDPVPEIPSRHHRNMMLWMFHIYYDTRDVDATDQKRAESYEERFTAAFGVLPSAQTQRRRRAHTAQQVAPDIGSPGRTLPHRRPYRPFVEP
jgi:hypothetical protein